MNKLLVFLGLLVSAFPAMASQPHPVIAAEQARAAALVKGDANTVAASLADDLIYIHSNGRRETKRDIVNGFETRTLKYEYFRLSDLEAREVTRDVTVLTGKINQRKFSSGQWGDAELLFHAIWRNDSGTWRLASLQTLKVPAPQK